MRLTVCRLLAAVAFAVPVFVIVPAVISRAAPAPTANAKNASPMDTARKALDEVGDMNYQNKTLNDVLTDIKDKANLTITVDPAIYQFGFNPNMPSVTVNLKQVKLKDGLRQALAPFNLRHGLTRDGLLISTEEGLTSAQLRQRVNLNCDGTSFATIAKELATDTGANLIIDPRLGDKAKKAVTLKLDDVPLETAVRLLAEVADLGTVRMNNVLFVTTMERAEKLQANADRPVQASNVVTIFPFVTDAAVPGGAGGFVVPVRPAPIEKK